MGIEWAGIAGSRASLATEWDGYRSKMLVVLDALGEGGALSLPDLAPHEVSILTPWLSRACLGANRSGTPNHFVKAYPNSDRRSQELPIWLHRCNWHRGLFGLRRFHICKAALGVDPH